MNIPQVSGLIVLTQVYKKLYENIVCLQRNVSHVAQKSRTVLNVTLVTIDEVYWLGTEVPRLLGLLFYYY